MVQTAAIARPDQSRLPADMLVGSQIRAARALLRWSISDLAQRCGVSVPAIQRAEQAEGMPNMQTKNLAAIKTTFEESGVLFLDQGDIKSGGPGVRFK